MVGLTDGKIEDRHNRIADRLIKQPSCSPNSGRTLVVKDVKEGGNLYSLRGEAPPLPTGADYRDLARKIREVAGRTRLPVARRELLRLAANYERRGDHLDGRSYYPEKPSVGSI
jgi:hypothetical protein